RSFPSQFVKPLKVAVGLVKNLNQGCILKYFWYATCPFVVNDEMQIEKIHSDRIQNSLVVSSNTEHYRLQLTRKCCSVFSADFRCFVKAHRVAARIRQRHENTKHKRTKRRAFPQSPRLNNATPESYGSDANVKRRRDDSPDANINHHNNNKNE
uniref:Uncharacterized protein n=1 Tax=Romanomermis culicivorax TaxID=13658 RepID=A0A915HTW3_ROMCU